MRLFDVLLDRLTQNLNVLWYVRTVATYDRSTFATLKLLAIFPKTSRWQDQQVNSSSCSVS